MRRLLVVAIAAVLSSDARASRIAGAPTDFQDHLQAFDAVFIGHVDSVSVGPWSPTLPCGQGLGPFEAIRWVVRVEETLQGSGLHDREVVLGFKGGMTGFDSIAGRRVLAFGNRSCSHGWHLWGFALVLDGDSLSTDCSYFDGPNGLEVPQPRASLWRLLRPLRERPRGVAAAVFDGFDGLGIFRATGSLTGSRGTFEVAGRWVASVKGAAPEDTVRLRFHPPPAWAAPVHPGDSLLVPWAGIKPAPILTFDLSPRVFQIESGFVTSLGRSLDALPALIVRRDERWRIPPIVYP
jgi:hypothetical protein